MAITSIEYNLFRLMRDQNTLSLGADILELGEANWYGDVPLDTLFKDISQYAHAGPRDLLFKNLKDSIAQNKPSIQFEIAKIWWHTFFQPKSMTAIDLHGMDGALKLDLNYPIKLPKKFGIVTNLGTLEHVFNVGQSFKTVHDYTLPGGLMIHGLPLSGWIDHGFYSFNSTFYWDLAKANNYSVDICVYAELTPAKLIHLNNREDIFRLAQNGSIGKNSLIYTVLRKQMQDTAFKFPMQGYYDGILSSEATKAWKDMR